MITLEVVGLRVPVIGQGFLTLLYEISHLRIVIENLRRNREKYAKQHVNKD